MLEKLEPLWQKTIAAGPDTPPTKEERKRWRKEYPDKYFLLPAEIYPWEDHIDGPHPFEVAMAKCTHITFYGASPHRPTRK